MEEHILQEQVLQEVQEGEQVLLKQDQEQAELEHQDKVIQVEMPHQMQEIIQELEVVEQVEQELIQVQMVELVELVQQIVLQDLLYLILVEAEEELDLTEQLVRVELVVEEQVVLVVEFQELREQLILVVAEVVLVEDLLMVVVEVQVS